MLIHAKLPTKSYRRYSTYMCVFLWTDLQRTIPSRKSHTLMPVFWFHFRFYSLLFASVSSSFFAVPFTTQPKWYLCVYSRSYIEKMKEKLHAKMLCQFSMRKKSFFFSLNEWKEKNCHEWNKMLAISIPSFPCISVMSQIMVQPIYSTLFRDSASA